MKKTVFFIGSTITIIMLIINILFAQLQKDSRPIVQGFIDASDISFDTHEIAWLSGEWNFIPEQFTDPEAFEDETTPFNSVSLQVPAPWDSAGIGGSSFPSKFYGTYHLQIQLPSNSSDRLGMYVPWINTAYVCYTDGEQVFSAGTIGTNEEEHVPQYLPAVIPFTPESDTVDIVFHVSNFSHLHPGIVRTIMLGNVKTINILFQIINGAAMFVSGIMVMAAAALIMLYAPDSRNRRLVCIALLAVAIAFRSTLGNTMVLNQMFPFIPWAVLLKIEYLTVPAAITAFAFYILATFPHIFSKRITLVFVWASAAYGILVLTADHFVFGFAQYIFYGVIFIFFIYWLAAMILHKFWEQKKYSIIFLSATLFGLLAIGDLINYSLETPRLFPIELSTIGMFIFIFGEVYLAAHEFLEALHTSRQLTQQLEEQVNERTQRLKEANQKLYRMAATDELTGLWNRNELQKRSEEEAYRHNRYYDSATPFFSVLYMDLDNFKFFNDTFSHDTGDFILKEFSRLLTKSCRRSDSVFRVGGDEFIMFLPRTDTEGAVRISQRIIDGIHYLNRNIEKKAEEGLEKQIAVTPDNMLSCSIGIAVHGYKGLNLERLIQCADSALLKAKETGKNRYFIYTKGDGQSNC